MSLLPSWQTTAIAFVIALVLGAAGGAYVDHRVMQGRIDKLVAQHDKALADANAANLKKQDELQAEADELEMKRGMENAQYTKDLESARADVRAGRERLSIPGACSAQSRPQAGAAAGPIAEERTDVLPGTADAIVSIAGASAKDVRDYNNLLDHYNAVCK